MLKQSELKYYIGTGLLFSHEDLQHTHEMIGMQFDTIYFLSDQNTPYLH
jgi:hypothetical protein